MSPRFYHIWNENDEGYPNTLCRVRRPEDYCMTVDLYFTSSVLGPHKIMDTEVDVCDDCLESPDLALLLLGSV